MRRTGTTAVILSAMVALLLSSSAAMASAPKFHRVDSEVANNGSLVVSFDERGLGHENVHYELGADVSASFGCFNGGGKHPQAANKETVSSELVVEVTLEPKNGRIRASIETDEPSPGDFECPPGQRLRLASVSYTDIVLTDTTNDVSADIPDASRVFIEL